VLCVVRSACRVKCSCDGNRNRFLLFSIRSSSFKRTQPSVAYPISTLPKMASLWSVHVPSPTAVTYGVGSPVSSPASMPRDAVAEHDVCRLTDNGGTSAAPQPDRYDFFHSIIARRSPLCTNGRARRIAAFFGGEESTFNLYNNYSRGETHASQYKCQLQGHW
jgi:hypothetical protein